MSEKKKTLVTVLFMVVIQLAHSQSQPCGGRYGSKLNGTCMDADQCTGALLNNLCSGSQLCCIPDSNGPNSNNPYIKTEFLSIVGDTVRTNAIFNYMASPSTIYPTCWERASFLSQLTHESNYFLQGEEVGAESSFAVNDNRADLGNTQAGDGAKYRGRGFIQITGRANYAAAGLALGLPLVDNPELAAMPSNAIKIAIWFWNNRTLSQHADGTFYSYSMLTWKINGGLADMDKRTNLLKKASQVLMCGKIRKGQGGKCNSAQDAKCVPLCTTGLEGEDFCGCNGATFSSQCGGPSNIRCCQETCDGAQDLTILLDSSGSVFPADFLKAKDFVKDLISKVKVSDNGTHVAIINYSYDIQVVANLTTYTTTEALLAAVDQIPQLASVTYTGEALQQCQSIYTMENGMRDPSYGVSKVIVLLTDGQSSGYLNPIDTANVLKLSDTVIYTIGVGSYLNLAELSGIASSGNYYLLSDYSSVENIVNDISSLSCTEPAVIPNTTVNITIPKDAFRYFRIPLSGYENCSEVTVTTREGETKLFTSFEKRNPNDLEVDGTQATGDAIQASADGQAVLIVSPNSTSLYIGVKGVEDVNVFSINVEFFSPVDGVLFDYSSFCEFFNHVYLF